MISYWEQQSLTKFQYGVIGGGLVGLSTALSIKELQPEATVAVFESGVIPAGASTRNAGFACFGSVSELLTDNAIMGELKTVGLVQDRWAGLKQLRGRLGDKELDYQRNGGYELLFESNLHFLEQMEYLNDMLEPVFKQPVFALCNEKIKKFGFDQSRVAAMISNPLEGQLDTGKMMRSLINLAKTKQIEYLTGAHVSRLDPDSRSSRVFVESVNSQQVQFQCTKVAVCTNAFTTSLLPGLDIQPGRGTILITTPVAGLKFKGVFHYDCGYYYFRNLGNRVLFGGGRNKDFHTEQTIDTGINQKIADHLQYELSTLILPEQSAEIEQYWSGIMAFGGDKRPLVGFYQPGIAYAVRLGGMGVALGTLVADQLANLICFSEND